MAADEGLLYLNRDVPVVSDSHLSDVDPCLATVVGNVMVPLDASLTKQLCCAASSKSNSC